MPLDPAAQAVVTMMDETFPRVEVTNSAEKTRAFSKSMARPVDVEPVARTEDRTVPGPDGPVPVRLYWPAGDGVTRPGIVYFHGGGWVICDLDSHDGACRRLANAVDAVVVSVDYRLAPEHPFPAGAEDSYAVTAWVAANASDLGIDAPRLAVAGDSAGGNLSASVALMARDRNGPPLAFQLMVYPVIDSSATRNDHPSKAENATGFFLTTASMEWYRGQYLASDEDGAHPYCSPLLAPDLAGLPAACVITAECDPLRDEGEAYARALEAAGVPVTLYRAEGMFHGFFNMDAILDGAKQAQDVAFTAMRAALQSG
jgi:acetyl esterase